MQEAAKVLVDVLTKFGPWGIALGALLLAFFYPEKAERVSAWISHFFVWTSHKVRRFHIERNLQGTINDFARSSDSETGGAMPYNMRLKFIKDVDRAELDPEKQLVIVRMRDRIDDDRNLVHAMLVFCPTGVLPQARLYMSKPLNLAIDVAITRKLLSSLKHHSALQYLHEQVLDSLWENDIDARRLCTELGVLDERGLFSRVVLPELRDFGASVAAAMPTQSHYDEAEGLIAYIHQVATRPPGQELVEPGYLGTYLRTAFVFVARTAPADAIMKHIQFLRRKGFNRIYLAARGSSGADDGYGESRNVEMAESIARESYKLRIARVVRRIHFRAPDLGGNAFRRHTLIEMDVLADETANNT